MSDTKTPDSKDADTKHDYRSTLFLPQTEFPMKAGLPDAELDPLVAASANTPFFKHVAG